MSVKRGMPETLELPPVEEFREFIRKTAEYASQWIEVREDNDTQTLKI